MRELGENLSREWSEDPRAPELWDALQQAESDTSAGLEMLLELAEQGSALSMMYIGEIFSREKKGIEKDLDKAELWLRRSADRGSLEGAYGLAWLLLEKEKYDEAIGEYRRLSEMKYSPAQYSLGVQYLKGVSVEKNLSKALFYFREAESLGHIQASNRICHILMGIGMGPISWMRGAVKKARLAIPFLRLAMTNPNSDRLRT